MSKKRFHIHGHVVAGSARTPVPNLRVEAWDQDLFLDDYLGCAITDKDGAFAIEVDEEFLRDASGERQPELYFRVCHEETVLISTDRVVTWNIESRRPLLIRLDESVLSQIAPLPEPSLNRETDDPVIATIKEFLPHLPDQLIKVLRQHKINTVRDIRRVGDLRLTKFADQLGDRAAVDDLQTFASLFMLTGELKTTASLMKGGYRSHTDITARSRAGFVSEGRGSSDSKGAQTHTAARARQSFFHSMTYDLLARHANGKDGYAAGIFEKGKIKGMLKCSCEECKSAVSPLAYLADLLNYTVDNVEVSGQLVTLEWLDDHFHQRFRLLPASCAAATKQVRQIRICVEVLLRYLEGVLLTPGARLTLRLAKETYRLRAYQLLLSQLGTSYDEIRLARGATVEARRALADRLGITFGTGSTDHVEALFLDHTADPSELTEEKLEQLFGLTATTNPAPWQVPANDPTFLKWQKDHLRNLWLAMDFPADVYEADFTPSAMRQPVIDPDVVGPDDFRAAELKEDPNDDDSVFDLWHARRSWADQQLTALGSIVKNDGSNEPDLIGMLDSMYQPLSYKTTERVPWPEDTPHSDFESMLAALKNSSQVELTTKRIAGLHLSIEAFSRLLALKQKAAGLDPDQTLATEEWRELVSILAQARKHRFFSSWVKEEIDQEHVHGPSGFFGPEEFWISQSEPLEGEWPPLLNAAQPLIDPEKVGLKDLADEPLGKRARQVWTLRRNALQAEFDKLKALRESDADNGLQLILQQAFGEPNPGDPIPANIDLQQLRLDLSSPDQQLVTAAKEFIETQLHLDLENFLALTLIIAKIEPSLDEWNTVYAVLVTAIKAKRLYSVWLAEESDPATPFTYWTALKAKLPTWRATQEQRYAWRTALLARSKASIIDPDLIGIDYLTNPTSGIALQLRKERRLAVATLVASMATKPRTLSGLNKLAAEFLGINKTEFKILVKLFREGESIEARIKQLNIDPAAFAYLARIYELVDMDAVVLDTEWRDAYSIFVQVRKRRLSAHWRNEEKEAGISLNPDRFQIPKSNSSQAASTELKAWRASIVDLIEWKDVLQSRVDQLHSLEQALEAATSAVEGATLTQLRDALVQATGAGNDLSKKADAITASLLIDAKNSSCQKTTRVAQAIETLQGLLFAIYTDQFIGQQLRIVSDCFNLEWAWIGSYATWRAAMFVHLYPENILAPTLRKLHRTPAFNQLLENCRSNRRMNPVDACNYAHEYATYFRDIASLDLRASCFANTLVTEDVCGSQQEGAIGDRHLHYAFARSKVTGTLYYCAVDPNNHTAAKQSFWFPIPNLEDERIVDIIGAVPYAKGEVSRYIFLFLRREDDAQGIAYLKLDLNSGNWLSSVEDLELPDISLTEITIVHRRSASEPPALAIRGYEAIYVRSLNENSGGWSDADAKALEDVESEDLSDGDWAQFRMITKSVLTSENDDQIGTIHAVMRISHWQEQPQTQMFPWVICFTSTSGGLKIALVDEYGNVLDYWSVEGTWLGFTWPNGSLSGGFEIFKRSGDEVVWQRYWNDEPELGDPIPYRSDLRGVVPKTGEWTQQTSQRSFFCLLTSEDSNSFNYVNTDNQSNTLLDLETIRVAPHVEETPGNQWPSLAFEITENLSPTQLQQKRETTAYWYVENKDDPNSSPRNIAYLQEAYLFVPQQLGLELQRNGHYEIALDWFRSVYDFSAPANFKKIYYGLTEETSFSKSLERSVDWLLDPLDPHTIASIRRNTYTRFSLICIIRCLLEFADAEFTRDTSESVARARSLYQTTIRLLKNDLNVSAGPCAGLIEEIEIDVEGPEGGMVRKAMEEIEDPEELETAVMLVKGELENGEAGFERSMEIINAAIGNQTSNTLGQLVAERAEFNARLQNVLDSEPEIAAAADRISSLAARDLAQAIEWTASRAEAGDEGEVAQTNWLREPRGLRRPRASENPATNVPPADDQVPRDRTDDDLMTRDSGRGHVGRASTRPWYQMESTRRVPPSTFIASPHFHFCVPPNPVLKGLLLHAELNLFKIRNCRNIAGMLRELEPYAAPTDSTSGLPSIGPGGQLLLPGTRRIAPTPYRYHVLIERAKHLVSLAQQVETAFLAMMEKRDAEAYSVLRAKQDVRLSRAGVTLQQLRVVEAQGSVTLATLRQERAQIQLDHFQKLLAEGISELESWAVAFMVGATVNHTLASAAAGTMMDASGAFSSTAAAMSTTAQILSMYASFERREQEWQLQKDFASQDILIAGQEIRMAEDHVRVANQERVIAEIQAENAEAVVDFLANKFTNVELYEWMSGILEGVYSFFLQQATAVAQLSLNQLSFERQEVPPPFIQADYWTAPDENLSVGNIGQPDRRGLTGSARLLQDIYQLDQYAFDTNKRKLQLTKIVSLARLFPMEFHQFRRTGVLTFTLPLELFDRDFPGDYLRLIRKVSCTVLALVPHAQGIRATLSTTGSSRVAIGSDVFQTVLLNTGPQRVSLTTPRESTGLFPLESQSEMLFPFEGMGVEATFEFRLERAANPISPDGIADVLLAIDYTALHSYDYRQQVVQSLKPTLSGERPFSFKIELPDQWFDLHNPDQTATPMTVRFRTTARDFPANLQNLKVSHVTLLLGFKEGFAAEIVLNHLKFTADDEPGQVGGAAGTVGGLISTRRSNGSSWLAMIGKRPIGEWELSLPNTAAVRSLFIKKQVEDILFMITYAGHTPAWSQ